jgi:hypothetical protein
VWQASRGAVRVCALRLFGPPWSGSRTQISSCAGRVSWATLAGLPSAAKRLMPLTALRKLMITGLLLAVWASGLGLFSRPAACYPRVDSAFDCCRISPLSRVADTSAMQLIPRVHSGYDPCCPPPLGEPSCLSSFQRPESPLPENPGHPQASLFGRRHRLYAACGEGFPPPSTSPRHPALTLLATVVLLN